VLVVFAILPFFSTLLGGTAAIRLRHRLHPFMAFAAGVLVATAMADLFPEATSLIGPGVNPVIPGAAAVLGFLIFSALEAFVHRETWEHEHQRLASQFEPTDPHEHLEPKAPHEHLEPKDAYEHLDPKDAHEHLDPKNPHEHAWPTQPAGHASALVASNSRVGVLGPISLITHSLLDGLAIGLAFRAGTGVGLLVGLAVLAHDFADGMTVVTLALVRGTLRSAWVLLVLDALAPPIGAAIGTFADFEGPVLGFLLATFSGVFLAIGAGHLLPEAQHRRPGASPLLVLLAALGASVVLVVRLALG
jgi:zinc and cadmium transporter